jgi:caffeoyl-CoA O-methyltransferase
MSRNNAFIPDAIDRYLDHYSLREPPVLAALREETASLSNAGMQISPGQGQLLALLVRLTGARKCLEVGTFTGYSSLSVALALPRGACVVACDVSEEWTNIAQRYWRQAGVAERIELRLGPELDTVDRLLDEGAAATFDFAFIDADKSNYDGYYERALKLLRQGGLIAVDNTLWSGKVTNLEAADATTRTMHAFNRKLHEDERIDLSVLPVGDGLTLARKR